MLPEELHAEGAFPVSGQESRDTGRFQEAAGVDLLQDGKRHDAVPYIPPALEGFIPFHMGEDDTESPVEEIPEV